MNIIRAVGEDLQKDPIFKRVIIEPIEVLGVDKLGDSSITIRSRMRTRPGKQWDVKRMFLLKLKQRFDKEKIEIPFPTVTNISTRPHTDSRAEIYLLSSVRSSQSQPCGPSACSG